MTSEDAAGSSGLLVAVLLSGVLSYYTCTPGRLICRIHPIQMILTKISKQEGKMNIKLYASWMWQVQVRATSLTDYPT